MVKAFGMSLDLVGLCVAFACYVRSKGFPHVWRASDWYVWPPSCCDSVAVCGNLSGGCSGDDKLSSD